MKTVSIIIPMYNCEAYVNSVLEALCGQTYPGLEIICVDDGSKDRTVSLVRAYEKKEERISVICQSHGGAGTARNTGLAAARGEYVMFLDADDLYPDNFVEQMVLRADETNADIIVCKYYMMSRWTGLLTPDGGFYEENIPGLSAAPGEIRDLLNSISSVPHNKLFLRNFLLRHALYFSSTESINDIFFAATSLIRAEKIAFLDCNMYTYRVHHNPSSITSGRDRYREDLFTVFGELYEWLEKNGLTEQYRDSFCRKWRSLFRSYASYGRSDDFAAESAAFFMKHEPFCSIHDDAALAREAGLTTARLRVRRWIEPRQSPQSKVKMSSALGNIYKIRRYLADDWKKNIRPRDFFISSLIWELRDTGTRRAVQKVLRIITARLRRRGRQNSV